MQEKFFYMNSKGEKLCAVLSGPGEDFDRPVVVLCHGFSSSKESKSVLALEQSFNAKNISTLRIDLYAHGESEGKFENLTVSEAVDDILRAIAYLKSKGYRRVGLVGSSFGGLAANIAASKTHDLFVLVLRSPVSDYMELLRAEYGQDGLIKWRHEKITERHGVPLKYDFVEDAERNNGYASASKIFVPTLIIHGDADESVPVEQSRKLASLVPGSRLEIVPGANHRYTDPKHFAAMVQAITDFVTLASNN